MKHFYCVCFSLTFLLLACQKKEIKPNDDIQPTDLVSFFYEKAKQTDSIPQRISFYNKGLRQVQQSSDTLLPFLLDHKIYYHNRLREYDSALFFADSLQRVANFQKDTGRIALSFYRKAVIHRYLDNQEAVFKNAFESRKRYLQLGDSTKAARRSLEMAVAQSRMQDYTGSQESATEALRYLNKEKDGQYLSSAYNIIAIAYRIQGFYMDAIKEYQNALRNASDLEDSLTYQNNIGLVNQDQKEYEKAISIFEDIYSKVSKKDYISRARYLDNLVFTKWLQDSELNISAELEQALQWRNEHKDHSGLISSYYHLSEFYENRNKAKAINYAKKWLQTGEANNSLQAKVEALEQLIDLQPGNAGYVQNYMRLNDSLTNSNLQAKNTFAKIRFDEERKQQQISGLEASAALQALKNQEIKNRNYLLAFLVFIVIGFAVFIIYYNRQKHKKEKIREIYNTETRISKVIHDELANDVYNVMSSMEAIAPTETMDKLEQIYSRTRNISRENSDITTGPGYLDHLLASLSSICPDDTRLIISGEKTIFWNELKPEKKLVIYRVLQEIMVNMKKHSQASLVALVFTEEEKRLKIDYSDNGVGSSMNSIKNGNGLQNVENRILSINGKLTFETEKGKGLKIMIHIPL
ncbi:tetratricopeptide repeat protein [Salegentibacter sp. JZCK2]|uniref:tetratricopeptide repeat-containing sensor histidine kinase n=1 Tax=Salegentibacter tibetensis TaxID=2873600 RepID=UPI001CC99A13|nr:tetratricopeptide repeat-containing sensor histidine kinase [Salegentibacter tibetensis]MBZ9730068.1 tetratricopeptide repeat protein [Salegentibacter tibetensis]